MNFCDWASAYIAVIMLLRKGAHGRIHLATSPTTVIAQALHTGGIETLALLAKSPLFP